MKNKHFLFSLSLAMSILVLMALSIFISNQVFEEIAQVITIPFLLFTIVSFAMSVAEEIVNTCASKIQIEQEQYNLWEYHKNVTEDNLKMVSKYENPSTKEQEELNKTIDERTQWVENAKNQMNTNTSNIVKYFKIKNKSEKNNLLQSLYVLTLVILIVSMMITPILIDFCRFIPTTTLTLLSLFLAITETLIKDIVSNTILLKMFKKYSEETEND